MSKQLPEFTIQPPVMSWDKPIEEEILSYVRSMRRNWQTMEVSNIHRSVRKEAKSIIMAYQSVEDHIVREIKLRKEIGKL